MAHNGIQPRILLVEDDPMVAAIIADLLEGADFEVDGPYGSLSDGLAAVAYHIPDAAVLDIGLKDQDVFFIAADLERYGVPFLFCSGSPPAGRMATFAESHPYVAKDRASVELVSSLQSALH